MSDVTIHKCDGCGNTAQNRYAEKGWINLSYGSIHAIEISVSKGKYSKKTGSYETHYAKNLRDFCSWKCLQYHVMSK